MASDRTAIFITCRDRVTPLAALVDWLERSGYERIYLVDNASTFPPLLEYLERSPHQVVRLPANVGQLASWTAGVVEREASGEWYVVTDPDVVPIEECPADAVQHFRRALERYPEYAMAGFGLKIDDLPNCYRHAARVRTWESQFWRKRFGGSLYRAPIDTTFALYRPYQPAFEFPEELGIRTGYPYLARHLPWYTDSATPTDEEQYYLAHARSDVTNWNGEEGQPFEEVPRWTAYHRLRWRAHVASRMQRSR